MYILIPMEAFMSNRRYKKGINREQTTFLPPRVEDYVSEDNSVRAIDAYVNSLDLESLGFKNSGNYSGVGQPPFSPASHLKLYIWGYLNRVRSSRRLENEAKRNLELIWLLEGLTPGYHSIADFRKDNPESLKKVQREFVLLCKSLDLYGAELIAIDSVYLEGDASRDSILTGNNLKDLIKQIDDDLEKYHQEMDRNDTIIPISSSSSINDKIAQLGAQRKALKKMQKELKESEAKQISYTDKDARLLIKPTAKGPTVGYAVQGVVDSKYKLIVANEVIVDSSDQESFLGCIKTAKDLLEVESISVVADGGYFKNENVAKCEESGDELFLPIPDRDKQKREKTKFETEDFSYDKTSNSYTCPAEKKLTFRRQRIKNKQTYNIYAVTQSTCSNCLLKDQCLSKKSKFREIYRSEYADPVDRLRKRMKEKGSDMMKRRSGIVEHPFGTIKLWLGWTHFLVRGINKVKGEMALITTAYNFKRVMNIIGIEKFIARCNA